MDARRAHRARPGALGVPVGCRCPRRLRDLPACLVHCPRCYGIRTPTGPGPSDSSYPCPSLGCHDGRFHACRRARHAYRPGRRARRASRRRRSRRPPEPGRASLSPSRAADFKTCPLLYRFRSHRPAPRAAHRRPGPRHAGARRAGAAVRPARRAAHPGRAADAGRAAVGAAGRRAARPGALFRPDPPGDAPGPDQADLAAAFLASARDLLGGYFAVEDPRRLEPAERESLVRTEIDERPAAAARLHRPARRLPRRRPAGGRLQDRRCAPRGVRGAGAVPAEVLRAGAVAHPRCGSPGAPPAVPQGRRDLRLHPGHRGAGAVRAHPGRAVGGHRAGHRRRATSGPSPAGCAAGARTRRCARRSAAPRRRSRSGCPWPRSNSSRRGPSRRNQACRRLPSGSCSPDDQPTARAGLRGALAGTADVHVVGEAGDGVQARRRWPGGCCPTWC